MTNQEYLNTRQRLNEHVAKNTQEMDMIHFDAFVTSAICDALNISRNLASQYLNERFKDGYLIKINSRPVYFFDKKSVLFKYNLKNIQDEYDDLDEFVDYLKANRRQKFNFEKAVGYNLTLRSAVEKCKVAVDYPPRGLSLYITGPRGTGKKYFAYLAYEYAKDNHIVTADSHFVQIDCAVYNTEDWNCEKMIRHLQGKIFQYTENDVVYFHNFDLLPEKVRMYLLELMDFTQQSVKLKARVIMSSEGKIAGQHYYIQKRIPVQVELPPLASRTIAEKELLIANFFHKEELRMGKKILITNQTYHILIRYPYVDNISQLERTIKSCCAQAFSSQKNEGEIKVTLFSLPKELIKGFRPDFKRQVDQEQYLTVNEIGSHSDFYREEKFCGQIIEKAKTCIYEKNDYKLFLAEVRSLIDEYNDYILFQESVTDEKSRVVEQTVMKIFDYVQGMYEINVPNSFVMVFSVWVYHSEIFYEMMTFWSEENRTEICRLLTVLRNESFNEYTVSKEIIELVEQNLEITLGDLEMIILTILLSGIEDAKTTLPIQASIICHGYATASSIADVCNKMLGKHVFNAIDMPYDMPVSEIGIQLKRILHYSENRDVILLVDIGSLENILGMIGEVPDVNFGILNNVSTGVALEVGSGIVEDEPLEVILDHAASAVKTSYRIIEKSKKEDIIIFVSEIGSDVAEKVSELFMNSMPKSIHVAIKCFEYKTFMTLYCSGGLEKWNVLFVAATMNIQVDDFFMISIEDIITFSKVNQIRSCLKGYLTAAEFDIFHKNMLNVFSLQNVVEALTILNASKVLALVDSMLDELQIAMNRKFLPKTIVGLNLHISCLIERLVKKEVVSTHMDIDKFITQKEEFILIVRKSFENIARQYNIEIPDSEIAYIYDYVNYEEETDTNEEDF